MDAPTEEQDKDLQVQKNSTSLLAELETSLPQFLWRQGRRKGSYDGAIQPGIRIRHQVRVSETERLIRLLSPFQELPQLLDPHLAGLLRVLVEAYLASILASRRVKARDALQKLSGPGGRLMGLFPAICRLIYTLCKIRGEKVIVRFFSPETKFLEVLLGAVERAEARAGESVGLENGSRVDVWTWEERYVTFLWISHMLLAPFDLSTISSAGTADVDVPDIPGLVLPENLPGISLRVVPLAIRYLASAGKERDAAKALLLRISMRKDMQELGLLKALVQWALSYLYSAAVSAPTSSYLSIGVLSYLAGILVSSAGTSDMDPYILKIFRTAQAISDREKPAFETIHSSALARKTLIKVLRTITVLVLQRQESSTRHELEPTEIVEAAIGNFLEALADNDTPVRLAASKALSVITLKLEPSMASQVVEAVLDSLNHNVLWTERIAGEDRGKTRDISAVNPLEWHGLIMTLSHLLYRRSPPTDSLSDILHALLLGLTFEQRSTSGSSIGSNVRDAACFGIWALARRYSTADLQSVTKSSLLSVKAHDFSSSILQVLATELVVTASLDPAGNIRRGASAALQELIGRHPDTVVGGIAVVQAVDYHAVALRSRAMLEVAPKAASISRYYEGALLDALLDWRGVSDGDAVSRRNAAATIGLLVKGFQIDSEKPCWERATEFLRRLELQLNTVKTREIEQRHGLLLSVAAVVSSLSDLMNKKNILLALDGDLGMRSAIEQLFTTVCTILDLAKSSEHRRAEFVAEGASRVILAMIPVFRADLIFRAFDASTSPEQLKQQLKIRLQLPNLDHPILGSESSVLQANTFIYELGICFEYGVRAHERIIGLSQGILTTWLHRREDPVINATSEAAVGLMLVLEGEERQILIQKWMQEAKNGARLPIGVLDTFSVGFTILEKKQQTEICQLILDRWKSTTYIKEKVSILHSLSKGTILDSQAATFLQMIAEGLDDYTTDGRGDIGSLVRFEALKATCRVFSSIPWNKGTNDNDSSDSQSWFSDLDRFGLLYGKTLRLAAEKLDRVRPEAQKTLCIICRNETERTRFSNLSISSYEYFLWLLKLQTHDWLSLPLFKYESSHWRLELLEGFVTSADTGSEDLIRASRAALATFCELPSLKQGSLPDGTDTSHLVCSSLLSLLGRNLSNDRILIPVLEILSFLFDSGIIQRSNISWSALFLLIQKSHFKSGNLRKLEAAIKVYGGLLWVHPPVLKKLLSMLLHPFPKVRNWVVEVLFVRYGVGRGVDWVRAGAEDVARLREGLEREMEVEKVKEMKMKMQVGEDGNG